MKNNKPNNVEKSLPAKGDLSEKEKLIKLASETPAEEFELDLSTGLLKEFEEAVKKNPKLKFKDWYYSRRQSLEAGGDVTGDTLAENYGDLIDSWVRKIDLASPDESLTSYINRVKAAAKND